MGTFGEHPCFDRLCSYCHLDGPCRIHQTKCRHRVPRAQSKWLSKSAAQTRGSDKEEVQFHYDICNEFFKLWQDPNQTYSCAYFERDDMTLEEAQMAKVDLSLGKLGPAAGHDTARHRLRLGLHDHARVEKYDVNVIGLTLSENQKQHIEDHWFANSNSKRRMEVRLQPWEEFDEPVDRIVSIGAFEHFGFNKYDDYFKKTFNLMPDDGVMMLHTIIIPSDEEFKERELPLTMSRVRFTKFIMDGSTPGSSAAGREVEDTPRRPASRSPANSSCDRTTPRPWTPGRPISSRKKDEAIEITSEESTSGS